MTNVRTRKIIAGILIAISFVFEGLKLSTDHSALFDALNIGTMVAGISLYPVDDTRSPAGRVKTAVAVLILLTIFIFILTLVRL